MGRHDGAGDLSYLLRGAAAGVAASVVQAIVGKGEDLLFLPPWEDSNIAPRLVERLAADLGVGASEATRWGLGTVFHLGYGATWGAIFAELQERLELSPLLTGLLVGGVIYGITFPRWGGAVLTETERPPEARTDRMTVVALSVALSYGLATAALYERWSGGEG